MANPRERGRPRGTTVLELSAIRDLQTEVRLAGAGRVPMCADSAYLLARARFLETIRTETAAAQAAS